MRPSSTTATCRHSASTTANSCVTITIVTPMRALMSRRVASSSVVVSASSAEVGSQLFELTGARSTSDRLRLDRFWRNARVHTLHDPVDYKLRDVGRYRLEARIPEPTPYS